jgi:threonine dehydratase
VSAAMSDDAAVALPSAADIRAAATRISAHAVMTPLFASAALDARLGCTLLLKAESLQRTGSFKFRGALNALLSLDEASRARGVVAFSSGNHAQGVAAAAHLLDIRATIVIPTDAPKIKIANTRAYGAEIVFYERDKDDREAIASRIAAESGARLIPPYDDATVIAGQGSVGLELAAQAGALGAELDAVVVPCSGGGLVAGIALALASVSPLTKVYAVEPESADDMRRSLEAGSRVTNDKPSRSICDCLLAATPGRLPFAVARAHLAGGLTVSDDEVRRAMAVAFADYELVLEPGGSAALAAVLAGKLQSRGKTIAVVASGGNVDRESFSAALAAVKG